MAHSRICPASGHRLVQKQLHGCHELPLGDLGRANISVHKVDPADLVLTQLRPLKVSKDSQETIVQDQPSLPSLEKVVPSPDKRSSHRQPWIMEPLAHKSSLSPEETTSIEESVPE